MKHAIPKATLCEFDRILIDTIFTQPTAPFREDAVAAVIKQYFEWFNVDHFTDQFGNIVVGCKSEKEYLKRLKPCTHKKKNEPTRLFVAHMDHPGFHGKSFKNKKTLEIDWLGGANTKVKGAPVYLAAGQDFIGLGVITRVFENPETHALAKAEVKLSNDTINKIAEFNLTATDLFGGFDFTHVNQAKTHWIKNNCLYTKSADDLAGVYAIVRLAIEKPDHFCALITRAEEVGFVGATAHFEWLTHKINNPNVIIVSLETSRFLPQAEIGKGPVVRLGDRNTVFDPTGLRILSDCAQTALPKRHQRRVMDGGACEATSALCFGLTPIALSLPLGNYHNIDDKTLRPSPEYISLADLDGMITLCATLCASGHPWAGRQPDAWKAQRDRLLALKTKWASQLLK